MSHKYRKVFAIVCMSCGVAGAVASPASATALYEHKNYSGFKFDAPKSNNLGFMNDRASSISSAGIWTVYFQDDRYRGARFETSHSFNDLRRTQFGNWNDRISSFHHSNIR